MQHCSILSGIACDYLPLTAPMEGPRHASRLLASSWCGYLEDERLADTIAIEVTLNVNVQLSFQPGASVKKAAAAVHKLASGNELKGHLTWAARTQYEHEVASLQRFLVDASVSGGESPLR